MSSREIGSGIVGKLWRWLHNSSAVWRSLVLLVVYISAGLALFRLAEQYGSPWRIQPWNPTAGLHVVLLLGFGIRYVFALPIAPFLKNILLEFSSQSAIGGLLSGIYVAIFYGTASAFLLYRSDFDPRLSQLQDVIKFTVTFAIASLSVAIFSISSLLALGQLKEGEWFNKVMHGWAGEATGIAMIAPPLLILLRHFSWSEKRLTLQDSFPNINLRLPKFDEIRDWLGLSIVTIFFTWSAYGGIKSEGIDYTYLTFIPLTLVCAWKGLESTTIVILSINLMAVGLVGNNAENADTLALQFGLVTVTYVGLLLSTFVTARKKEINKRQDLEKQLRYDATHDNLTGLYNRAWFLDRLEQTQNKANENENYLYAVLFLDLDRFKTVNDSLGHLIGDRLLVLIAQKLRECLPEHTSIARLGGDEFTIILEDISDIDRVSQIAEAICHNLGQTYIIDRYQLFITVSIGIAVNSSASQSLNLLRDADIALYEAKAKGKSQYVVFDSQMYERVVIKTELEQDLRQAINELDIPQ